MNSLAQSSGMPRLCEPACIFRLLHVLTVAFAAIFWTSLSHAQSGLTVEVGKSFVLPGSMEVGTVFIADPGVADANVSPNNSVFVFGKAVGETTLTIEELGGERTQNFTIRVTHNLSQINRTLASRFPGNSIAVESSRGSILVTGTVTDEQRRGDIIQTLQASVPESAIIDRLTVAGSNLIRLQVRLIEVQQSVASNYGIDWNATVAGSGFSIGANNGGILSLNNNGSATDSLNASVDVLVNNGVATILQETTLSTVNGGEATFSVGEEIPVPTFISDNDGADNGNFSLDYKFVGTRLIFRPASAPGNKIRMNIDSLISSETQTNSTVNGNVFANLNSRSFQTSVELGDRQPFVIAGLTRRETDAALRASRGTLLSNAVNTVFGRDTAGSSSRDLVVIVTPILNDLGPVSLEHILPDHASNLEFILSRGFEGSGKIPSNYTDVPGPAGFKY